MNAAEADEALAAVVLAAGRGTRLGDGEDLPAKVLLDCLGVPLLEHVRRALGPLRAGRTLVVTGHRGEDVEAWLARAWPDARPARQSPQRGTGDAVRVAMEALGAFEGDVLVVYGDVPQVDPGDLARLVARRRDAAAAAALLTGRVADPGLLGRVLRDDQGAFRRIVEARDATPEERAIGEFNTGLAVFRAAALRGVLPALRPDNVLGEIYLTDVLGLLAGAEGGVVTNEALEPGALLGVNDWADLAAAHGVLRRRIAHAHLRRGVRIADPETTVIEADVEIAPGARILPFTFVGRGCRIARDAVVGPFARLRGGAVVGEGAEVGNFVEVKASTIGPGAKAKHLAYLGDADVGAGANVGCGVVTANYDGRTKHRTTIGARASIGSGTILVAPVTVGPDARTGANAVVLPGAGVPAGATAVGVPARILAPGKGRGAGGGGRDADGPAATGEETPGAAGGAEAPGEAGGTREPT